ncbi:MULTISPECIES: hypothetical protein [unclassified Fusibacter]|uniref:hypothetical protein n=1 Tax=unclassified Fusibacter TaxID=2624464 RepID=UPI001010E88D|nr:MULTISPECIES: hypothetical protein [unclassified Fusibacter]MCK8060619.1 hypothetical protein [Fusibacter sp. A2]NPE22927.1 hypothetical protein [Fusibacter sp. A1]RXV59994.1 hypothetical protein DWB64_13865 [Fusibacter sp. A1]
MGFIILAAGLFALICTVIKPSFYWESRKAKRMRKLMGDGITTVIYLVIGSAITVAGLLEIFGVINLK